MGPGNGRTQHFRRSIPSGARKGRAAYDSINGMKTHFKFLRPDFQGNLVDPRFGTMDRVPNLTNARGTGHGSNP